MEPSPYEQRYAAVYRSGGDRFYPRTPSQGLEQFVASLTRPPGVAVLLGCGEGRNIEPFARRGWHVHGVDLAANAIERASHDYADFAHVEFHVADVTKPLAIGAGSVDLVVVINLHHLLLTSDLRTRLHGNIRSLLCAGGIAYIETNGSLSAVATQYLPGGHFESRTIVTAEGTTRIPLVRFPTVMLNGATLRSELEAAGLAVERMWAGQFEHPDTVREQIGVICRRQD